MHLHDCSGRHLAAPPGGAQGPSAVSIGPLAAAGLTAALAGLAPPQPLDRDAANQVGGLVLSGPFAPPPRALVVINVAGIDPGDEATLDLLSRALPGGTSLRVRVNTEGGGADGLLLWQAATASSASSSPGARVNLLDEGCGAECVAAHLGVAAMRMGGHVEGGEEGGAQTLRLPCGAKLALGGPAGLLFASELVALHHWGAAARGGMMIAGRAGGAGGGDVDVDVYTATLVGLQAMREQQQQQQQQQQRRLAASAAASAPVQAVPVAAKALAGALALLASDVARAYGGDVVYQIMALGDAAAHPAAAPAGAAGAAAGGAVQGPAWEGAEALAAWRQRVGRSMLAAPSKTPRDMGAARRGGPGGADGPAASASAQDDAKRFSVQATVYGVALLLGYASGAVIYSMANMPFKEDTLLYGRTRTSASG